MAGSLWSLNLKPNKYIGNKYAEYISVWSDSARRTRCSSNGYDINSNSISANVPYYGNVNATRSDPNVTNLLA